jgi:predicted dehydrogenase
LAHDCGTQAVDSLEALIDMVDVVDICAPTHLHHEMVLRAAAAGKHILCEKPLARTAPQGDHMIAVCQQAGVKLLVAHVVRFFPEYARAKAIVDRGEIGRVGVVRLRRASALPTWSEDNWLMDDDKSGGMMLDLMVHDFDYARWVAGEVESVFAKNVTSALPREQRDYALAILRHANGALSHIEGGWAYPAGMFRTALEIAGDGGLIEHPSGSSVPLQIYLAQTGTARASGVPTSPLIEDPYVTEIKHFYDVIAHGVPPRVTAADGVAAVRIALAAIESAQTGQRVTM